MKITSRQFVSAVIDRIVDEMTAVLLLEEEQAELHVPLEYLPLGSVDGQWLLLEMEGGVFVGATLDEAKMQEVRERISKKRALLLERMARGRRDRS
jgi:hypothetical protein